jgi:hypothetical protein
VISTWSQQRFPPRLCDRYLRLISAATDERGVPDSLVRRPNRLTHGFHTPANLIRAYLF